MIEELNASKIPIEDINPVDYFNREKIQEAYDFLLTIKGMIAISPTSLSYVTNRSDTTKEMIVIENGNFVVKMHNGLKDCELGDVMSPFMVIQKFMFKKSFSSALEYVRINYMGYNSPYIRVGTKYYKHSVKADRYGVKRRELKLWEKQIIIDDYGKKYLAEILTYDDFTIEPDNKNYRRVIDNNYNLYSPFEHKLCSVKDYDSEIGLYWTMTLLEHIFGEQIQIGLKYMKVLYAHPKTPLPILVLTSDERETGKTTYIDYLNMLFGTNMVVINPQDISSNHNNSYSDKNIIAIEESKFESTQALEKLKNLSTQKEILVNPKHVNPYSIPFYGKIIITSNDEAKFSRVDKSEIRYWVRKVPSLKGKANHQILKDLHSEIPTLLRFLDNMPDIDFKKSRMVFQAVELKTEALETVKAESLPSLHKDIQLMLTDHSLDNRSIPEFKFTAKHIKDAWFKHNHGIELNYINRICKDSMQLDRGKMQRFVPLEVEGDLHQKKSSGTPFIFKNEHYEETSITANKNF